MNNARRRRRRRPGRRTLITVLAGLLAVAGPVIYVNQTAQASVGFPIESLDGSGNNVANPNWGKAGTNYARILPARYADGRSQPVSGPNTRFISNRIFNDNFQNIFSEGRVTQWGWTWGQFLDHTFGLAEAGTQKANIGFNGSDPLESFTNTLGTIPFTRDAAAPGTGFSRPRETRNTVNSYIDAHAVYGPSASRLEWLRDGRLDGNLGNNAPTLMLPGGFLPRATARGNASTAPAMAIDGRLLANPGDAMVAGDVRANENIALTATHTLFAREHNRIVSLLPSSLSAEDRFQIARRIVIAEQQYITYNEFLPAMGVPLPRYTGYRPNVSTALTQEFATVGYRAHSQIHGEFTTQPVPVSRYTQAQLDTLEGKGVEVALADGQVSFTIPLNVAFFNPDVLQLVGEGPMLSSLSESEYQNDEQIDNGLRSVLFQVPRQGSDPACVDQVDFTPCFQGVT
ncbi:MAG: peroxidase family protein, partial [Mycobacterium sp.]|nr:peroxidase family protein [Mycobacterium sp.]